MSDPLKWLRDLDSELWTTENSFTMNTTYKVVRTLTKAELHRILACVEEEGLLTEMCSDTMFGGYCMTLYDHPPVFGVPPIKIFDLSERVLPPFDRYDRLVGQEPPEKKPGCGQDRAWELFSRYTHSEQNRKWLKYYGMEAPQGRYHYDY